jgi:Glycosyl transferase family 2
MSEAWRPTKVCVIDLESCPEAIDGEPGYAFLWALVRERGRPRGMVKLQFNGAPIGRDELNRAIAGLAPVPDLAHSRPFEDGGLPKISVVVPTLLGRPELLSDCLKSLSELDYPDYEVIVVDNRPAEAPDVELAGVRVVREPHPGPSAARNRGLDAAHGEIVAFTDDDVVVDPGWLLAIALRLRDHAQEVCVTGPVVPREIETPAQVALEEYYGGFGPRSFQPVSHKLRWRPDIRNALRPATVDAVTDDGRLLRSFSLYATGSFGIGANMSFRTRVLRELGGFSLALGPGTPSRGGEDLNVFARLAWRGHCLGFEPGALVRHTHRRDLESLDRQIHTYGVGYTALLTSLVFEDPRHFGRIVGTASRALRLMTAGYRDKLDARNQPNPRTRELARLELRGMAIGPLMYLRSRVRRSP